MLTETVVYRPAFNAARPVVLAEPRVRPRRIDRTALAYDRCKIDYKPYNIRSIQNLVAEFFAKGREVKQILEGQRSMPAHGVYALDIARLVNA